MSLFKIPSAVANEIVRLQRDFLWGWGYDGRKVVRASWKKVCEPHETGGLGIIDLRVFNLALLGKWIWRLRSDKGSLWKEILESKYGGWRVLRKGGKSSKDSLWWRDLKEVWSSEGWGRNFEDAIKWRSGTGKEIVFWEDNWVGNGALKEVFTRLFSLSLSKESKVAEFGAWNNGQWAWTFAGRRSLFEWEKQLECQFSQVVQGVFGLGKGG